MPGNALFSRTMSATNPANNSAVIRMEIQPPLPGPWAITFGMLMTV